MMRTFVLVSLAVTSADSLGFPKLGGSQGKSTCIIDSAEAVSDALDAAAYVWAATKRCGKAGQKTRCAIDAMAVVESLGSMSSALVKVLSQCTQVTIANAKCGNSAGDIVSKIAAIGKSSTQMYQRCPEWKNKAFVAESDIQGGVGCAVDIKNSAKSIAEVVKSLGAVRKCSGQMASQACQANIIGAVSAVAGMGEWISGIVGDCMGGKTSLKAEPKHALCVQGALGLTEELSKIAKDGLAMSHECSKATRGYQALFEEQEEGDDKPSNVQVLLLSMLPAVALVSFVVGRRTGTRVSDGARGTASRATSEMDMEAYE